MDEELIKVEMTPQDALLFVAFQKRYALIKLLDDVGAFTIKSGNVVIHFDNLGGIGSIDVNKHIKVVQNFA